MRCSACTEAWPDHPLRAVPGGGPDSIRAVLGEIGLDMSVFGTSARLCSWARVAPATRADASCMPAKTGLSVVPSPYRPLGMPSRPAARTASM